MLGFVHLKGIALWDVGVLCASKGKCIVRWGPCHASDVSLLQTCPIVLPRQHYELCVYAVYTQHDLFVYLCDLTDNVATMKMTCPDILCQWQPLFWSDIKKQTLYVSCRLFYAGGSICRPLFHQTYCFSFWPYFVKCISLDDVLILLHKGSVP